MECRECKEKLIMHLSGELKDVAHELEEHLRKCPQCSSELKELREITNLLKNKDIFCPKNKLLVEFARGEIKDENIKEHINKCEKCSKIYNALKAQLTEVPEIIEKSDVIMSNKLKQIIGEEYPALKKEEKKSLFSFPLKLAYTFALILCALIGVYFINDYLNSYKLAKTETVIQAPLPEKAKKITPRIKETAALLPPAENKKTASPAHPKKQPTQKKEIKGIEPIARTESQKTTGAAGTNIAQKETEKKAELYAAHDEMIQPQKEVSLQNAPALTLKTSRAEEKPSLEQKIKKILADYKDIKATIKEENSTLTIYLTCPKNTKKETIEEVKNKLTKELQLKKDIDKIILILE